MQRARDAFATGKTRDINFRIRQLEALLRMYEENETEIVSALYKDLRKPKYEARMFEIEVLKNDVRTMIQNCREWAKPQRVSIPATICRVFCFSSSHRRFFPCKPVERPMALEYDVISRLKWWLSGKMPKHQRKRKGLGKNLAGSRCETRDG